MAAFYDKGFSNYPDTSTQCLRLRLAFGDVLRADCAVAVVMTEPTSPSLQRDRCEHQRAHDDFRANRERQAGIRPSICSRPIVSRNRLGGDQSARIAS